MVEERQADRLHPPALRAVPVQRGRRDRRLRRRPHGPGRRGPRPRADDRNTPFETIETGQAMSTGKCDIAAAGMTITEERDKVIDFSDPYFNATQALLVEEGRGLRLAGGPRRQDARRPDRHHRPGLRRGERPRGRRAEGLRGPRAAARGGQDRQHRRRHQRQQRAVRLRRAEPRRRGDRRVRHRRAVRLRGRRGRATPSCSKRSTRRSPRPTRTGPTRRSSRSTSRRLRRAQNLG